MVRDEQNTISCAIDLFDDLSYDSKTEMLPEKDLFNDLDPLDYNVVGLSLPPVPQLPVPSDPVPIPVSPVVEREPTDCASAALNEALGSLFSSFDKLDEKSVNELYNRRPKRQRLLKT